MDAPKQIRILKRQSQLLAVFLATERAWLIVASAAGSAHNPDWYHNLAAHPDQVWIELPGRSCG